MQNHHSLKATHEYIHAIDGLRAVAILLVLLFHAGFSWIQGGFIGVDIFFVISGFLITKNISESIASNQWSFKTFYIRRAARLLPALFTVIVIALFAAKFIQSTQDFKDLSLSAFWSTISASNVYFWTESGYFSAASETKPLLHTWSLGVEEQFYMIWPLILFLSIKLLRKNAYIGLLVLAITSLISALILNEKYPDAVFFLMPFRIFQFCFGALLALCLTLPTSNQYSWLGTCSVFGMILIATWLTNDSGGVNGVWINMVAPAALAALFIYASKTPNINLIFASKFASWIGRRSYSIYLAHWPIIVLWNMATDFYLSPTEGIVAILLSIFAGSLLYKFIETPFRFGPSGEQSNHFFKTGTYTLGGFVACSVVAIMVNTQKSDDLISNTIKNETIAETTSENTPTEIPTKKVCFMKAENQPEEYTTESCANPPKGKMSILVLGDSYAGDMYIALSSALPDAYIGHFVVPGCGLQAPSAVETPSNHCKAHYKHAYNKVIDQVKFDAVMITSNWLGVSNETITEVIAYLISKDIVPVITGMRPRFRERIPVILETSKDIIRATEKANELLIPASKERNSELSKEFSNKGIYIDYFDLLCPTKCTIVTEKNQLIYRDDSHLSTLGAWWLGKKIYSKYPMLNEQIGVSHL